MQSKESTKLLIENSADATAEVKYAIRQELGNVAILDKETKKSLILFIVFLVSCCLSMFGISQKIAILVYIGIFFAIVSIVLKPFVIKEQDIQ